MSGFGLVGRKLGRYELRSGLGSGGFADVYLAQDRFKHREVAVKILKVPRELSADAQAEFIRRFEDEATLTGNQLDGHPNIRQVFDMGVYEEAGVSAPWMAMELLEGETLADALKARRLRSAAKRSAGEVLGLFGPVLDAVAFAHEHGIVHRDLKPANIFLARTGGALVMKVLDFGIAKVLAEEEGGAADTRTTSAFQMFSAQYGAPEQFGGSKTGKYTDVFALGLVLTELLTDEPPLSESGDRTECMMAAADSHRRPTPRMRGANVSDAVEAVVAKAVSLRAQDRYPDARALLGALRTAAGTAAPAPAAPNDPSTSFAERLPAFGGARPAAAPAPAMPAGATTSTRFEVATFPGTRPNRAPAEVRKSGNAGIVLAIVGGGIVALGLGAAVVYAIATRVATDPADPPVEEAGAAVASASGEPASAPVPSFAIKVPRFTHVDAGGVDLLKGHAPSVPNDAPWKGNPNAKVVVQEWCDLQAPFCNFATLPIMKNLQVYGDRIKYVWRDFPMPLNPDAALAAEAGQEVFAQQGNAAFWKFRDAAYAHQKQLKREDLFGYASPLGVDMTRFNAALDERTYRLGIVLNQNGAKSAGVTNVPAYFVNDYFTTGTITDLVPLIERALAEAR